MARDKTCKTDKTPDPTPKGMDLTALWIRHLQDSDAMKTDEALQARRAFAVEVLRSGGPLSQAARDAIAELLEPKKRGRGRPTKPPMKWYEAGQLLSQRPDLRQQAAAEILGIELRTLQAGLRYYRQASMARNDAMKDEI